MSDVREQVYECIVAFMDDHGGLAPTISEISKCVGKSGTAVRWHLDKLEEDNRISRIPGRAGGIIIT